MTTSLEVLAADLSPTARRVLTTALTHTYDLVVRGIPARCALCGIDELAVAVIHPDFGGPEVYDAVDAEGGTELGFAKELLEEARHPLARWIKPRRCDDGEIHLSSGCSRCDARFDPYELADAVAGVRAENGLGSLPVLARVSRTIAEWAMLAELAKTSAFDDG